MKTFEAIKRFIVEPVFSKRNDPHMNPEHIALGLWTGNDFQQILCDLSGDEDDPLTHDEIMKIIYDVEDLFNDESVLVTIRHALKQILKQREDTNGDN